MNTALWIIQIVLGLAFFAAGMMKATNDKEGIKEKAGASMAWVDDLSDGQLRAIGVLEVLGGIGLVLPAAVGVLPILTPLAAGGLALTMIGAMSLHVRRSDGSQAIAKNVVLGGLAAFVAVQRFGPSAF